MKRKDLIDKIVKMIDDEELIIIDKDYIIRNCKIKRNGIYFLYNENDIVIYAGKVGDGSNTSFYDRMYGHGSGAHCRKSWFNEAKKFRFRSFPNLDHKQISQVERLMIYAKQQPKYNDCYATESDINAIFKII